METIIVGNIYVLEFAFALFMGLVLGFEKLISAIKRKG